MRPFYQIVGNRALEETRSVILSGGGEDSDLPAGDYAFMEFYCTDPGCDCRRVILQVWRKGDGQKIWATLTYGWESPAYYAKWSGCGPGAEANEMASVMLEQISPQTDYSPVLLELFKDVVLADPAYIERLKRHYREACSSRTLSGPRTRLRNLSPAEKRRERLRRRRG